MDDPPKRAVVVLCHNCKFWEWSRVARIFRCGNPDGLLIFMQTPPDFGCTQGRPGHNAHEEHPCVEEVKRPPKLVLHVVLDLLREFGPQTKGELAERLGIEDQRTMVALTWWTKKGDVVIDADRKFRAPRNGDYR